MTIREHIKQLLQDPNARTSTSALAIVGVLRQEIEEAALRETNASERAGLQNLAAALPKWGA